LLLLPAIRKKTESNLIFRSVRFSRGGLALALQNEPNCCDAKGLVAQGAQEPDKLSAAFTTGGESSM
jgi:hypothetical protein